MKKATRLIAKGRCESTLHLIDNVLSDYHQTRASIDTIAQVNQVSPATASKIVDGTYFILITSNRKTEQTLSVTIKWNDEVKKCCAVIDDIRRDIEWIKIHWRMS